MIPGENIPDLPFIWYKQYQGIFIVPEILKKLGVLKMEPLISPFGR